MKLKYFQDKDFLSAIRTLFIDLKVPMNYVADEPTTAREILKDTYKDNETFNLVEDVFFVGMVDDAAFEGNKSLAVNQIKSDYDGILVFGIILKQRVNNLLPTRSQLADIARAFNREFYYTPAVLIFKYKVDSSDYLAFANTERLKYKQSWREGEKAGKVSLLRDINITNPHSGHERIIEELRIPITGTKTVDSFSKLYNYWQEVFSVSVLNKKFYQELSNWYFWALKHVTFPNKPTQEFAHQKNAKLADLIQEHNATNVIRLLTRLLFTWFIKEKRLIPEELFDLGSLQKNILKEISPLHEEGTMFAQASKESIYYKAILQNLFFATLNCPIEADARDSRLRGFRGSETYGKHRGIDWMMRYSKYFKNSESFLELMNITVPFLNGGLFECLDDKTQNLYIDGFSDQMTKGEQLIVPDYLFFGANEYVDLSVEYGVKNKGTRQAAVKGLINIFKAYKFTITENTPIEEDVALDPELLGQVFENLLASYNPETKTTARKQTGSFYTPREIVNYMVDESLIAYLRTKILGDPVIYNELGVNQTNAIGNAAQKGQLPIQAEMGAEFRGELNLLDQKLHELVSYDPANPFADHLVTTNKIVKYIDQIKILDPACGSGAFPMGALQKMVHILQKLDPENEHWKEVQIEKALEAAESAFIIEDSQEREKKLIEINNAFDERINNPDFARKLYLIENCIYGVDIQPIATQISKLRFFISLVVDQKVNRALPNFGISTLPNLETRFVAADTLIGIEKPIEGNTLDIFDQSNSTLNKYKYELKWIRHKLFSARTKETKLKYRARDKELRDAISDELKEKKWPVKSADQLASWDPYDQNVHSSFFDSEWMFDISEGFDVVIGNPPFVLLQERIKDEMYINWIRKTFTVATYKVDLYHLFYEKGIEILNEHGVLTYISPTNFLLNNYTKELRRLLLKSKLTNILLIQNSAFDASVDTSVFTLNQGDSSGIIVFRDAEIKNDKLNIKDRASIKRNVYERDDFVINPEYDPATLKLINIISKGDILGSIATVNFGMQLRDRKTHSFDVVQRPDDKTLTKYHKKCYTGRDIKEYYVEYNDRYCFYNRIAQRGGCWEEKAQFAHPKILVPQVGKFPIAGIDLKGYAVLNTAFMIVPIKENIAYNIMAILNSPVVRYFWLKKFYDQRNTFPKIKGTYLKNIPLPEKYDNVLITTLTKMIAVPKYQKEKSIKTVLGAAIMELYFPDHLKEQNIDVLEYVEQDIERVLQGNEFGNINEKEKEGVVEQLSTTWEHPDNEVRNRIKLFAVRSPEILKPILES